MNEIKSLLESRSVPTEIIEKMDETKLRTAYGFIKNADLQCGSWGMIWTWDDCPNALKEIYFN